MALAEETTPTVFRHLFVNQLLAALAMAGLMLCTLNATAQEPVQEVIDQVVDEVVDATLQRAAAVASRQRSVDAWRHGFADDDEPPPQLRAPIETRRAMDKLRYEYNRNLERLEQQLRHELTRLAAAFRRDTGRDSEVSVVQARRAELESEVAAVWEEFRRDVGTETARASERRGRIIAPLLEN